MLVSDDELMIMTEIERINQNINGEVPSEKYDIIYVREINNAENKLTIFKQTVLTFIDNKDLDIHDELWNELLPEIIVKFTSQLNEIDFGIDDLLVEIPTIIYRMQKVKEWEWFSSKLNEDGFEVYMKGIFRGIFLPLLHQQGIPVENIFIERDSIEYPTRIVRDVLSYRKWDAETMILSPGEPK